jgi:hypothetical protein
MIRRENEPLNWATGRTHVGLTYRVFQCYLPRIWSSAKSSFVTQCLLNRAIWINYSYSVAVHLTVSGVYKAEWQDDCWVKNWEGVLDQRLWPTGASTQHSSTCTEAVLERPGQASRCPGNSSKPSTEFSRFCNVPGLALFSWCFFRKSVLYWRTSPRRWMND